MAAERGVLCHVDACLGGWLLPFGIDAPGWVDPFVVLGKMFIVFTLFIFVLCSNFFGMVPGSFTVTSQIAVTLALACLVVGIVSTSPRARYSLAALRQPTRACCRSGR